MVFVIVFFFFTIYVAYYFCVINKCSSHFLFFLVLVCDRLFDFIYTRAWSVGIKHLLCLSNSPLWVRFYVQCNYWNVSYIPQLPSLHQHCTSTSQNSIQPRKPRVQRDETLCDKGLVFYLTRALNIHFHSLMFTRKGVKEISA